MAKKRDDTKSIKEAESVLVLEVKIEIRFWPGEDVELERWEKDILNRKRVTIIERKIRLESK